MILSYKIKRITRKKYTNESKNKKNKNYYLVFKIHVKNVSSSKFQIDTFFFLFFFPFMMTSYDSWNAAKNLTAGAIAGAVSR